APGAQRRRGLSPSHDAGGSHQGGALPRPRRVCIPGPKGKSDGAASQSGRKAGVDRSSISLQSVSCFLTGQTFVCPVNFWQGRMTSVIECCWFGLVGHIWHLLL